MNVTCVSPRRFHLGCKSVTNYQLRPRQASGFTRFTKRAVSLRHAGQESGPRFARLGPPPGDNTQKQAACGSSRGRKKKRGEGDLQAVFRGKDHPARALSGVNTSQFKAEESTPSSDRHKPFALPVFHSCTLRRARKTRGFK